MNWLGKMRADRACTGAVVDIELSVHETDRKEVRGESKWPCWGQSCPTAQIIKINADIGFILHKLNLENCAPFWQKGPESYQPFWGLREEAKDGVILKFPHTYV